MAGDEDLGTLHTCTYIAHNVNYLYAVNLVACGPLGTFKTQL